LAGEVGQLLIAVSAMLNGRAEQLFEGQAARLWLEGRSPALVPAAGSPVLLHMLRRWRKRTRYYRHAHTLTHRLGRRCMFKDQSGGQEHGEPDCPYED
jgi:hypothetical protein